MTDNTQGTRWFLAQIKPNSHALAERNLKRQGFQTFLPKQEETRRINTRFVTRMRPLFPGYLFVALDTGLGGWRAVNSTLGITRLVGFGEGPVPVPDTLVSQLMRRCDPDGNLLPPQHLAPGDEVTVTQGPLASFIATIESIAPDRRVYVLMDLMGARTRVAMDVEQLRLNPERRPG